MDKLKLYMFAREQHVFIHFMNFPAILVQVYFLPPPNPPTHPPMSQTVKKIFFMDLSISCNFLQFWFRCIFYPPHPPTSQTVKKKIFFFHGFIHFLQFWFRCIFTPPPPPPPWPNSEKNFSWIYPFHEISCNFASGEFLPPPPNFFHVFIHFMKFLAYDDYCVPICWDLGSTRFSCSTSVLSVIRQLGSDIADS